LEFKLLPVKQVIEAFRAEVIKNGLNLWWQKPLMLVRLRRAYVLYIWARQARSGLFKEGIFMSFEEFENVV
jgi:hypothetical protein